MYLWARRSKINFRPSCIFLVWESNPIAPEGYRKYFPHLSPASCQSTNKDIHSLQRVGLKIKGGCWGFWYHEPLAPEKTIWEWYTLKSPIGEEGLKKRRILVPTAFVWESNPALACPMSRIQSSYICRGVLAGVLTKAYSWISQVRCWQKKKKFTSGVRVLNWMIGGEQLNGSTNFTNRMMTGLRVWWNSETAIFFYNIHELTKKAPLELAILISLCPGVEPSSRPVRWNKGGLPIYQQRHLFVVSRPETKIKRFRIPPMKGHILILYHQVRNGD